MLIKDSWSILARGNEFICSAIEHIKPSANNIISGVWGIVAGV